jgi:hypothetical protein
VRTTDLKGVSDGKFVERNGVGDEWINGRRFGGAATSSTQLRSARWAPPHAPGSLIDPQSARRTGAVELELQAPGVIPWQRVLSADWAALARLSVGGVDDQAACAEISTLTRRKPLKR